MHGFPERPSTDSALDQRGDDRFYPAAYHQLQADAAEPAGTFGPIGFGEAVNPGKVAQSVVVAVRNPAFGGDVVVKAFHLRASDRGLEIGHPVIEAIICPSISSSRKTWIVFMSMIMIFSSFFIYLSYFFYLHL